MASAAYRQSSRRGPGSAADPDNRLLGHFPLRRLDAEAVRDGILAVSGTLAAAMYGPPVPVKENEVGQFVLGIENKDTAGRFTKPVPLPPGEEFRRSVYVQVRRSRPFAVLDTFDWATTEPNCEVRNSSTVTPQALMLLNGEFLQAQSEAFAARAGRPAATRRTAPGRWPTASPRPRRRPPTRGRSSRRWAATTGRSPPSARRS